MVNTYVYNKRRLLTGETLSQNGVLNLSLGQGYNSNGHLSAQTWPQGPQVTYAPNALGQPTQAGTFAIGVQYYPNGVVQQFVYGNGIVHQMQQNARQLPARSTDTGTLDLRTSFDVNGNVTAISDLVRGAGFDRQMQYDGNDRLTNAYSPAFGGDGWYRFGYDALDNLRTWTQPGEGQRRYNYDASNRLTVVSNAAGAAIIGLGYDVQGNLSIKNGQAYQFDFGNRLRQATGLERYRYDGHGRRGSVIDAGSGKNRHYLYSQGGALAYLWDQGTGETTQYIQLAGSLLATRTQAAGGAVSVKYQHADALGSPVAETNEQAAVVKRTAYTPYGASIGAMVDGVGYTGHVMDGSTGLTYMQQRYMDSGLGVFLSVDPVTAHTNPVGAFHRYRYGNSSPYRFVDPDGRLARLLGDDLVKNSELGGSPFVRFALDPGVARGKNDKKTDDARNEEGAQSLGGGGVDPYKFAAASLRVANSGRLAASAFVKLGVAAPISMTGGGAVPGSLTIASAAWNLKSSLTSWNTAKKLYNEGLSTDTSGYTATQKFRLVFMGGVVPFGTLSDDPGEPGYERAVRDHLRDEWNKSPADILGEVGGVMP